MRLMTHGLRCPVPLLLAALAISLSAAPSAAQTQAIPTTPAAAEYMQPIVLSEAQVKGFVAAMKEFRVLDAKSSSWNMEGQAGAFAKGMQFNAETKAIMSKHGFADEDQFRRVAYNTAMAQAVLKQGGKDKVRKDLDAASRSQAAAMEKLKQHLSPDQLKAIQAQAAAGMAMAGTMNDVPEQNLVLVKKYSAEIDALSKK